MFCGSHSGLKSRTSKADVELVEITPHDAHLRLLGTVILGPTYSQKQGQQNGFSSELLGSTNT